MLRRPLVNLFALLTLSLAGCTGAPQPSGPTSRVVTTPPAGAQKATPQANQAIQAVGGANINAPGVRVALLLPLTGESQALGQSMLDAATLALYDTYIPLKPEQIRAKLVLIPKDTGSSPATAAAATQAVIDQGASLIIGPLYGASVSAAAPVAKRAGVPMLSLSNNKAVASENVYVFGFVPEQQIQRVAEYAASKQITTVGALLPNDAYGTTVADSLKAVLTPRGVQVDPVEMYARTPANLQAGAARLKQAYDRAPFQGLFIADGGEQLKQTLSAIQGAGISRSNVRLLGTGLWDDESVSKNPDMQGAWFASSPSQYYSAFERRFQTAYGYKPQRLSSLTYDAITLAATLALQTGTADFSSARLAAPQGFIGPANGLYRLNANGTSERGLAVMEITPAGFKTLEAAPKQF